jgi:hypothetical protein
MAMSDAERARRYRARHPERHAAACARWVADHPGRKYLLNLNARRRKERKDDNPQD